MIAKTFDEAFEMVKQLAITFRQSESHYLAAGYSESQARKDFIDKFWMALGWDVDHLEEKNPYEQRVKVEHSQREGLARKRADYAFLADNFRDIKFYVEAKKPSVEIDEAGAYFQTIRYGWNGQTPLAVLTDFQQFRVLDCRYKPDIDSALHRVVLKFDYNDYADESKFRQIYHLFSREAVADNSIEKFAAKISKPSGPSGKAAQRGSLAGSWQSIDEVFLQELDEYREQLARAFKTDNPDLDSASLTEATQRTLDRLVFMRFLEDKLIETEPIVERFGEKGSAWQDFIAASRRLDKIYNGVIFKQHSLLDSPEFHADEKVFEDIRERLAHTNSPYDFNSIPIHILGSIYERFLGKTIVATDKRARVEEKPEVRKAGGVYYTPEYIVRYIVANSVGKLIEGKAPEEIREMHFADIACGSGSFLLGVYDLLLRHHTTYYNANKTNRAKAVKAGCIRHEDGTLRLSMIQKRQILLDNIYGVDIDPQAVEVAQLSLYLKMLEDETPASARNYQLEFREALLPSLNQNIVCGNSLIGWDIENGRLFGGDHKHLNPMDLEKVFKPIVESGGFDAIVGNPPYIRIQTMQETAPESLAYYKKRYAAAAKGNYDIYVVFVERALNLLNKRGELGYILPHKFFNAQYGEPLRKLIADGRHLSHIVHFGDQQVFAGATTYTCLFFLSKAPVERCRFVKAADRAKWEESGEAHEGIILNSEVSWGEWNFSAGNGVALFDKLSRMPAKLKDVAERMYQGSITSADTVFLFKDYRPGDRKKLTEVFSKELGEWVQLESKLLKPVVRSGSIHQYKAIPTALVLFPYEVKKQTARLFSVKEMRDQYPLAWAYLKRHKTLLESRERGKFKDSSWYRFGRHQNLGLWEQPKLMVPYMVTKLEAYPDLDNNYYFINVTTGGYGVTIKDGHGSLEYYCALFNSPLLDFYLKRVSTNFHGGYFAANKQFIEQLPIRPINFNDKADKERHDQMVTLVQQIVVLKKRLASVVTEQDQRYFGGLCGHLEDKVNRLVYELYGLTKEEIAIVEHEQRAK
ncbi:MAG: Eco57I restriction-modification methylase domain-containing protein [Blastocatellia bacterium]